VSKSTHADFGHSNAGGNPAGTLAARVYQSFAKLAA
jgi:hypothetical protein